MTAVQIINPATGRVIESIPSDSPATVAKAFAAARDAQVDWAARPLRERLATMQRFRAGIENYGEELAQILTSEVGKPIAQARNELKGLRPRLDFFLQETPRALRAETVLHDRKGGVLERITREPLGVIANISAWNYPYFVGSNVFIPALLAGNAVLYKPSEYATRTGLSIARWLHESGVPESIFAPLTGRGEVGAALLEQPVDGVFFTGSHATGRKIARSVAGRLIKVQLELGGKDPVYVCDDVEVNATAAEIADGAFYNAGQSCCAVERLYVHAAIFDAFVERFVETISAFKVGDPTDENTDIGPLARREQLAVLEAQVADATARGARILLGGKRIQRGALKRGNYFAPTVLVNVSHTMRVMREESFGPIIGVMPVRNDAEAVEKMNATPYGLTAGVYTPERRRAEAILAQVRTGSAYWNCCDRVSPRLPWSGRKNSGLGLTLSREGIQTFTHPKAWHLRQP
jgi:acyl-CoA reductase-like NAD-dependent aldehyde dehydrogenase